MRQIGLLTLWVLCNERVKDYVFVFFNSTIAFCQKCHLHFFSLKIDLLDFNRFEFLWTQQLQISQKDHSHNLLIVISGLFCISKTMFSKIVFCLKCSFNLPKIVMLIQSIDDQVVWFKSVEIFKILIKVIF